MLLRTISLKFLQFAVYALATFTMPSIHSNSFAAQQPDGKDSPEKDQTATKEPAQAETEPRSTSGKAADGDRDIPSLEEMLKIAMVHNPDIRAAEAKVRVAQAELERARLEVVKELSAFRERWLARRAAVRGAEQELSRLERLSGTVSGKLVLATRRRAAAERTKLRELETELPFLLGRTPATGARPRQDHSAQPASRRQWLTEKVRPLVEQIIKLSVESFRSGKGDLYDIVPWQRRLMELDLELAESQAARIAAVEDYRSLLKSLHKMVRSAVRAGQLSQNDVLVLQYHLLEADRLLTREKDRE